MGRKYKSKKFRRKDSSKRIKDEESIRFSKFTKSLKEPIPKPIRLKPTNYAVKTPIKITSRGEDRIEKVLNSMNCTHYREKTFPGMVSADTGNSLRVDFYIPHINVVIEYDGEQHRSRLRGISFKQQLIIERNDNTKNKYCKDNGIRLVRIPSSDFDLIEDVLREIIL